MDRNSNKLSKENKMDQLTEEIKNLLLNSPPECNTVEATAKLFI